MDEYTAFAYIYDEFMDNIPYEECSVYLKALLKEYGITEGTVAELGCGTGTITRVLARAGYDVVGIDLSEDMLTRAQSYEYETDEGGDDDAREHEQGVIIYSHQDMREFTIPYKVNAVVSISDSMNYVRNREDLLKVFHRVYECLEDGGILIFDLKTDHFFKKVLGNKTITDIRDEAVLIWENEYDENKRDNTYYLTMFIEDDENEELYNRYEEIHVQHAFTKDEVENTLRAAGLEPLYAYEAFGRIIANQTSERIYYIARKKR